MSLLARSLERAARRPRALGLAWAFRLTAAWIVASPLARTLTAASTSRMPAGDALLFEPGGVWLAEAVRLSHRALGSELVGSFLVLLVLGWLALLPLGTLLVELGASESSLGRSVGRAVTLMPRLTLLAGATLFVQGAIFAGGVVAAGALRKRLAYAADERLGDLGPLALVLLVSAAVLAVGVIQDLARAALVADDRSVLVAVRRALTCARTRALSVFGGWSLSLAAAIGAVLGAAWITGRFDVSRSGEWRVLAVFFVHQLAIASVLFARASWLAAALELDRLSPTPPASAGRPADSAAPADPSPRPAA